MSNGMIVLCGWLLIVLVPATIVGSVLLIVHYRREYKKKNYLGKTTGIIVKIKRGNFERPSCAYVGYSVDDKEYEIHETLKLKIDPIKVKGIWIGQRKTWKIGPVKIGDLVDLQYDIKNPSHAIIVGNDGLRNVD